MRKKLISIVMMLSLLLCTLPINVFAADPNIDGGGGGMGSGTSENSWSPGMDGVRVTIVNAQTGAPVTTPIDYTNKNPASGIIHFGKRSKVQYKNGTSLSPVVGGYNCIKPSQALPTIVSLNGSSNVAAIRSYFTDEQVIRGIALDVGVSYETLINGNYKLFLEPIAYFKFQGNQVGMTAHEAAMYDQQLSGGLRSKMASLSHQNLPLAMFLERSDLGFPAFSGDSTGRKDNATNYSASLTTTSTITPDTKVPTASGKTMRSGYGVNNKVSATFSSAPTTHVTSAQAAVSYFPEFKYNTYWRLLDLTVRGFSAQLEFKSNKFSTYTQRSHFSPVWYPNGTYRVYTYLLDAWTPAGMLSMNLNDSVTIQGSVFDDWHLSPKN